MLSNEADLFLAAAIELTRKRDCWPEKEKVTRLKEEVVVGGAMYSTLISQHRPTSSALKTLPQFISTGATTQAMSTAPVCAYNMNRCSPRQKPYKEQ